MKTEKLQSTSMLNSVCLSINQFTSMQNSIYLNIKGA
jgi:hypothetical protein